METQYFQDGSAKFLRLKAAEPDKQGFKIRMINQNQPDALLTLHLTAEEEQTYYDYNITGLVPLTEASDESMQARFLYSTVFSLERLAGTLESHMLQQEEVLLEPSMIYLKMDLGKMYFCYLPGHSSNVQESVQKLMEYFLKKVNPVQEEEILLLYGLYQRSRLPDTDLSTLAGWWRAAREKETASVSEILDGDPDGMEVFRANALTGDADSRSSGKDPALQQHRSRYAQEVLYIEDGSAGKAGETGAREGKTGGRSSRVKPTAERPGIPDAASVEEFSSAEEMLYEDLGLKIRPAETPLDAFRKKNGRQVPESGRYEEEYPGRTALTGEEDTQETVQDRLMNIVKAYAFEIILAVLVLIGVVIWFIL